MQPLPRVRNPELWRNRAEAKERAKRNSSYERRMFVLAVARQMRAEMREEKMRRTHA